MVNLIAQYVRDEEITVTELAQRLRTSKGSASEMISGKRRIGPTIARRMEKLTGLPWHEFVSPAKERQHKLHLNGVAP